MWFQLFAILLKVESATGTSDNRLCSNFVAKSGSALLHFLPLKSVLAQIIYRNGSYFGRVSNNLLIKILVKLLLMFLKGIVNIAYVFKGFVYFFYFDNGIYH